MLRACGRRRGPAISVGKASRIEAEELQQCRISPFLPSAELCEITPEPGEKVTWRQLSDATLGMLQELTSRASSPELTGSCSGPKTLGTSAPAEQWLNADC